MSASKNKQASSATAASAAAAGIFSIAASGNLGKLKYLVNEFPEMVLKQDAQGYTPLHYAAANNHVDCVKLLIEAGAEVDKTEKTEMTPLHYACEAGAKEAVEALLIARAYKNAQDMYGRTPLYYAAHGGYLQVVELLLQHRADPDLTDEGGNSPLEVAKNPRVKKALQEASRDCRAFPILGSDPLHITDPVTYDGSFP